MHALGGVAFLNRERLEVYLKDLIYLFNQKTDMLS
jgi:hypothetical protein